MGLGDDNCLFCYMLNGCNFSTDETELVCGKCVNYMMDPDLYGCTSSLASAFKVAALDCGKDDIICFLCNKNCYFVFKVHCCDKHENMYSDC